MMNINQILNGKSKKSKPKNIMGSNIKKLNLTGFETKGSLLTKDIGVNIKSMQINKSTKHNNLSAKSILGGMSYKPMKSNFNVNIGILNAKPKKHKAMIPKYNIVNDSLLNQFRKPAKRHTTILGDKITKNQSKVLNKKSIIPRFGDWDKDGVINALDCEPRNPLKHGFADKAKSFMSKFKPGTEQAKERMSQGLAETRKEKQQLGLAKHRVEAADKALKSAKYSLIDQQTDYYRPEDSITDIDSPEFLKANEDFLTQSEHVSRLEKDGESSKLSKAKQIKEKYRLAARKEKLKTLAEPPMQKIIEEAQLELAKAQAKAGIPQKTKRYVDAQERYESLKPENYNNTKEYEDQLREQLKQGKKQKQKEINATADFGFKESLKEAESDKEQRDIKSRLEKEGKRKIKEQEKIIKESRREQKAEQKERDSFENKQEKELKSKLKKDDRFKKMQDAGVKIRKPFTAVKEGFQNMGTAFSKTPEEQKRELERQQAKLEKNAPRIESAFNKYSPYASEALVQKYRNRLGIGSGEELPLSAKRAIAEEGRKQKQWINEAKRVTEQQRKLSLLKAKQDYRTMKKLAPAETRQRKGYLDLLSNQTKFNMEQLARQRAEAKAREQEQMRVRQIRNLQQRQQRYYQNQQANQRAFNTEPGEGLSVFFTDGIPNQPPTTQSKFKFL